MPIVRIEMWSGRSETQRADMAKGITEVVHDVADVERKEIIIVFTDVAKNYWAKGGKLIAKDDD